VILTTGDFHRSHDWLHNHVTDKVCLFFVFFKPFAHSLKVCFSFFFFIFFASYNLFLVNFILFFLGSLTLPVSQLRYCRFFFIFVLFLFCYDSLLILYQFLTHIRKWNFLFKFHPKVILNHIKKCKKDRV
jgi:predicted membrane protein